LLQAHQELEGDLLDRIVQRLSRYVSRLNDDSAASITTPKPMASAPARAIVLIVCDMD
jgi:hypothetical protein